MVKEPTRFWVATSQTMTAPCQYSPGLLERPLLPAARYLPSGEKARQLTESTCWKVATGVGELPPQPPHPRGNRATPARLTRRTACLRSHFLGMGFSRYPPRTSTEPRRRT